MTPEIRFLARRMSPMERWMFGFPLEERAPPPPRRESTRTRARQMVLQAGLPLLREHVDHYEALIGA